MAERKLIGTGDQVEMHTTESRMVTDPGNSTDTPLGANGEWEGTPVDVSGFNTIQAVWDTDAAGSLFFVTCHDDGSDWRQFPLTVAGDGFDASFTSPRSTKFRLRVVNGDKPQTRQIVRLMLSPQPFQMPMSAVRNTPTDRTLSLPTRSTVFGRKRNAPAGQNPWAALPLNDDGTAVVVETIKMAGPTPRDVRTIRDYQLPATGPAGGTTLTLKFASPFPDVFYGVCCELRGPASGGVPAVRVTGKAVDGVTVFATGLAAGWFLDVVATHD